jgi:uncharacterized membrane protein
VALFLLASAVLAISALPALMPFSPLAWASRTALAATCHQRSERCFALDGVPLAACARCTGIHAGAAVAGLLLALRPRTRSGAALAGVAVVALAADVAAGILHPAWDHPWLRFLSGAALACTVLPWAVATGQAAPGGEPWPATTGAIA